MQPLTMKSAHKKIDVKREKAKRLLRVIIAWTIAIFLAPHIANNYFYGTSTALSVKLFILSIALPLSLSWLAYKERKQILFDIFLIGLATFTLATGTSTLNNSIFSLHYGDKIKGDINAKNMRACQDRTTTARNSIAPYAIDNNTLIILCPQSNTFTGLFYETDHMPVPSWLGK